MNNLQKRKVVTVFGTRPEAIKMAPLVWALRQDSQINCKIAVTAQHREMLDQVLELFHLIPDYDLDIMETGQTPFEITTRALNGLRDIFERERPDLVLVHGDTSTTFAGALAAYYLQIPVGHVEAGLRSGNKYAPFPEEMNRRLTGTLGDLHFAPTPRAREELLKEGHDPASIYVTGNTVIDALLGIVDKEYQFSDPVLRKIDFAAQRVLVVTTHRRENLGEPLRQIYAALRDIVEEFPDVVVVFPVHKNPAVRRVANELLGGMDRIKLIEPLDYLPFGNLMDRSYLVLTDSGGLQEEAPSLGKPVLVLRENTERPEAVEAGTVKLVGLAKEKIYQATKQLLTDQAAYNQMAKAVNPYGDGKASRRIVESLQHFWGWRAERPEAFIHKPGEREIE
ncbi:MAG TPA: UDP-N-acetylglucosamine 2-epimerase (non-hydrolyzing) [Clostridia bacterium]|jgi:UDP-N-acetylglucosamine 2-epimerase (non-hydrolysing)|nr:UDP-N-acetylglucosamine 2-epimerase (non-hydrolyzing) [Clostridia bacterium]